MTQFWQLAFDGLALGAAYALIALGFVIVYRSSEVLNFAQGAMLLVGAYLVSTFTVNTGLPFWVAAILSVLLMAAGGLAFQVLVLRRMLGKPLLAIVMMTLGLSIAITAGVDAIWGPDLRVLGDPWGASSFTAGGVVFLWVDVWCVIVAAVVLAAFFIFERYSRYGLAMRATAADPEAALGSGVPVRRVHALAWAIAGVVATISGIFLSGYPSQPNPQLGAAALLAFPAIVLGGLESTVGAVVGGVVIGIVQELVSGYAPSWTGDGFYDIAPYIVLIIVLLVKPYGLFGSRPAERL